MDFDKKSFIKINEMISRLFLFIRVDSKDENTLKIIEILINEISIYSLRTHKSRCNIQEEVEKLNESNLSRSVLESLLDERLVEYKNELRADCFYDSAMIEILNALKYKYLNQEYEKVSLIAYCVHNFPSFLLGEYEYSNRIFWKEMQLRYIGKYNELFLDDSSVDFFRYSVFETV